MSRLFGRSRVSENALPEQQGQPAAKPRHNLWPHVMAFMAFLVITFVMFLLRDRLAALQNWGYAGVFLISLISSATIILPVPGLAFTFAFGSALPNPLLVGLMAGLGDTVGELTGYLAGYSGRAIVEDRESYQRLTARMQRSGPVLIFVLAAIPSPAFDFAGVAAGALRVPVSRFFLACWLGKTIKTTVVALAGAGLIPFVIDLLSF